LERQLKDIFDYYSIKASPRVARKMINRIIDRAGILESNPFSGPKEELLSDYRDKSYIGAERFFNPAMTINDIITVFLSCAKACPDESGEMSRSILLFPVSVLLFLAISSIFRMCDRN
jgi:plasmid stabilization system protein ParE